MTRSFDVIVIGAGPAGYVAALRCAQLGLNTAVIDEFIDKGGQPALGGTCLNIGCIPSKALLDSSQQYHYASTGLARHGIRLRDVELDLGAMLKRKDQIVADLTGGIRQLFKANKIQWLPGHGTLHEDRRVEFSPHEGDSEMLQGGSVILAAGSQPMTLDAAPLDGERIVDSAGAMEFPEVPKRLGIIGAGVIGLEMGSVWNRLGSKVVLLEAMENFLATVDQQLAREAQRLLTKQGLDIRLGSRVTEVRQGKTLSVHYEDQDGEHNIQVDRLIVAVGRRPRTENLAIEDADLLTDEQGFIHVNEHCETNLPGVYAVGDAVRGPMLAHKGSEEGVMVAERLAGQAGEVNYDVIPWVIYTHPEIAWVGQTEQALKSTAEPYRVGSFSFGANGRARAMDEPVGLIKIIAHGETDRILGVHILGPQASELIAEAVLAMEYAASAEDLARTVHAHPTLSEAMHEAALSVHKRALHKVN
ncbi:MAG: dihydrolipoyl dehydrogenase [Nitrococcus mobilis]|nr:dihydrolipoyl dehydrogenase [Nitrococcus mobilis]